MPTPATMAKVSANRSPETKASSTPLVPFIRASAEHTETMLDTQAQLTANLRDMGVFDVPAYGYARAIVLHVEATGGAGTSVTGKEDGPFNVLQNISLAEPGGAPIAQFTDGYQLAMAANKFGAFNPVSDPRQSPNYSSIAAGTGNFSFLVRIPLEINARDGLGSLANQNGTAPFKLRFSLAPLATVYGTAPTTAPTVRVRAYLEAWDQPLQAVGGVINETQPPANDTTQFFSVQQFNVAAGLNTLKLGRVGNYIRSLLLIYRTAAGSRTAAEAAWPEQLTIMYDARPQDIYTPALAKDRHLRYFGFGANIGNVVLTNDQPGALENGVWCIDFTHEFDGRAGFENNDLWLPTQDYTRLELVGNFGQAGTLQVITNDVAVAGGALL